MNVVHRGWRKRGTLHFDYLLQFLRRRGFERPAMAIMADAIEAAANERKQKALLCQ